MPATNASTHKPRRVTLLRIIAGPPLHCSHIPDDTPLMFLCSRLKSAQLRKEIKITFPRSNDKRFGIRSRLPRSGHLPRSTHTCPRVY